jgi:hypothetical protein
MSPVRRLGGVVLILALVSCDMLPSAAQKGPTSELERQVSALVAPNADIVDQPFEDLLVALDLPKTYGAQAAEILDQIHKTRANVAAERTSSSAPGRSGLASVARSVGTFSIPHFAVRFGEILDQLTKQGGTVQLPSRPYNSQETGEKSFTTTTLNVAESFTGQGAHVTATVTWSYSTITIETATGKTIEHITDERTLIGGIDVCPDASGVPATLDLTSTIVAQGANGTTTRRSTGKTTFQGTVSEQAVLTSVAQRSKTEASTESSAGNSGYNADMSATWTPRDSGGDYLAGNFAVGSTGDTLAPTGSASAADAARGAGWDLALNGYALSPAYKAAQDLWRHGRCVMVTAPDYTAETPINTLEQEKSQNDEAVDQSSETKFSISLKHRFGGALSAPTAASLTSGARSITPNRIDGGSGALTYKAPDEDDKKATVKLQSTSKRGIGTLVLDFHTGGALTLTITGEARSEASRIGTVKILDIVKVGPLEFKQLAGDIWQATGAWSAETSSFTTVAGTSDTCTGSDAGTITVMATVETRQGKRVWVIDPGDSDVQGKGTVTCVSSLGDQTLRGVTIPGKRTYDSDGDAADLFMRHLDPFTVPADGGTVRVRGATGGASGSFTSEGTATAKQK